MGMLARIGRWLLKKFSGVVLILFLGVGGLALWLYLGDSLAFADRKAEMIALFNGERAKIVEARDESLRRLAALEQSKTKETARMQTAARAAATFEELESSWDRLFGDREQQRSYRERREKMLALKKEAAAKLEELERELRLEGYTRDGLELALGKLDKRIEEVRKSESKVVHYVVGAWRKCRWYVLAAVAGWVLGPLASRALAFYCFAPRIGRGRPIRFAEGPLEMPSVSESSVALDLTLSPGESLCVKERFLQASDESLTKRTRWLFDWRVPFSSLSCGLTEMIELVSEKPGVTPRVTLSMAGDPLTELCVVTLGNGSSLILRPRHIAGVLLPEGTRLGIRRRWVFNRWQSWITFQFRFFEFRGPVRIVLHGLRGIRVEDLRGRGADAARRANSSAIIAFTPDLDYRPARAETFWAYYRGQNSLFDDVFSGQGLFLCQASAKEEEGGGGRFWSGVWQGVLKAFGL